MAIKSQRSQNEETPSQTDVRTGAPRNRCVGEGVLALDLRKHVDGDVWVLSSFAEVPCRRRGGRVKPGKAEGRGRERTDATVVGRLRVSTPWPRSQCEGDMYGVRALGGIPRGVYVCVSMYMRVLVSVYACVCMCACALIGRNAEIKEAW